MSLYLSKQEVLDLEKTTLICVGKTKYVLCEFAEDSSIIRVDICNFPVKKVHSKSVAYFFSEPVFSVVPATFSINTKLNEVSPVGFCDVIWRYLEVEQKSLAPNITLLKNKNHLMALFLKSTQTLTSSVESMSIFVWDDKLFLTFFKKGKLINANTFDALNLDETIYYTMLFVQEYQINQELSQIFLFGDLSKELILEKEIRTYFRNVTTKKSNLINDPSISGLVYLLTSTKI